MEQQRRQRRRRQPFNHPRREAGHDVGHRHGAWLEAVGLEPLHHAIIPGRREQLDAFQIGDAFDRPFREHLGPAAMSPVEEHEPFGLDAFPDGRRQLLGDVVQLVVRLEKERDVEDVERPVDVREPYDGERGTLEHTRPHLPEDGGLVALRVSAEDRERDATLGRLLPVVAHLLETFVPNRSVWNDGGELQGARLRERRG